MAPAAKPTTRTRVVATRSRRDAKASRCNSDPPSRATDSRVARGGAIFRRVERRGREPGGEEVPVGRDEVALVGRESGASLEPRAGVECRQGLCVVPKRMGLQSSRVLLDPLTAGCFITFGV